MNKKINLPLAMLRVGLLLAFVGATCPQTGAASNSKVRASQKHSAATPESYTHAVAMLRSIAGTIGACPRSIEFDASRDSQPGDGPMGRSRLFYGPPVHVTWSVNGNSIRSYQGYVQFSVPREFSIPPDGRKQWADEAADFYAEMLRAMPPLEYRYKFGPGIGGLQLVGILVRTADEIEWKDVPIGEKACSSSGCAPACWQSAAQPTHARLQNR